MTCFIDNPNVDAAPDYRRRLLDLMPEIKKSRHCGPCLAKHSHEVEPIDCPYYQEYLTRAPSRVTATKTIHDDLL
jgi:hypothetical protein